MSTNDINTFLPLSLDNTISFFSIKKRLLSTNEPYTTIVQPYFVLIPLNVNSANALIQSIAIGNVCAKFVENPSINFNTRPWIYIMYLILIV